MFNMMSGVLADEPGRFGPLRVVDAAGRREMDCGPACLGASWLEPAFLVEGVAVRPGPLPAANYLLGWLVAAADRPDGHVLMAGLGSGAGPIALAAAFPALRVTVAEIDPAVITLARMHFPLLGHFERQGRITVLAEDIRDTVRRGDGGPWSIACLDAFVDDEALDCPPDLLDGLHGLADDLWLNLLDWEDYTATRRYGELLEDRGWRPAWRMPIHDGDDDAMAGNVLLGTRKLHRGRLRHLAPFLHLPHPRTDRLHRDLQTIIARMLPW